MNPLSAAHLPRLVPERTTDSLFAAEVFRHDPHALIWSPTQFRDAWDHTVSSGARLGLFECKAVVTDRARDPHAQWRAPVPLKQLHTFAFGLRTLRINYVLLGRPTRLAAPHRRTECQLGACDGGWCRACCRDARSSSFPDETVKSAPLHSRLQPWFCHWTWSTPATALAQSQGLQPGATAPAKEENLVATQTALRDLPHATRLCHLLAAPGGRRARDAVWTTRTVGADDLTARDFDRVSRDLVELLEAPPDDADPEGTAPLLTTFSA